MAKAAVVPEPEAMNPLSMLKDAFLYQGAFAWMFYFCLAGFCAANAMAILGPTPKMNYFHGAAMMVRPASRRGTLSNPHILATYPRVHALRAYCVSFHAIFMPLASTWLPCTCSL